MTQPRHAPASISAGIGKFMVLFLSFLAPAYASNPYFANAQRGPCPGGLKCHHGGECATGDKDHSLDYSTSTDLPWLEVTNINGEHCINCHEGYGGVDCSRMYQICNPDDPDAPTCFNGSECYKMGISVETGKYEYMCDCTAAGLDDDGVLKYAGKYCQHISEQKCGSGNDEMFCTNGGKCTSAVDENMIHSHFICTCPDHRGGTHCEFLKDETLEECHLECEHGTCAKGFKTYDNLIGTGFFPAQLAYDVISTSGEHCVCPDGYTGLTCEIAVQSCGSAKNCYNGSTCIYDENGDPLCDCNSAHTAELSFAGTSCEQESTTHCEPGLDQDQKDAFCANHGQCIEEPDARHEGCNCADGWSGDICDIQGEDEQVCDLDCENGGSCRFGVKGYKDTYDNLDLPVHAVRSERGMHCSCPSGFTGLKCEVSINHCQTDGSESEHFCLNGVPCDPDDTNVNGAINKFSCQCDIEQGETSPQLAGRFCEYAVTEFCSKDRARHNHSFCTNGGKCKKYNDHDETEHHGCCCPDGYEGEHCQLPKGTLDESLPISWSPLSECTQAEWINQQNDIAASSNPNEHIWVNPVYKVPRTVSKTEEAPLVESASDDSHSKSNTGGIVSGIFATLLVAGLAGVAYRKRSMKDKSHQFETDWWRGHNTEWWKGESTIDVNTNIAPATLSRTWSYPIDQSLSGDSLEKPWEYADELSDLHDVVI